VLDDHVLASSVLIVVFASLNALYLSAATKRKQEKRDELLLPYKDSSKPDGGDRAWADLGDRHPDFAYVL
jgi:hypothetical protein